MSLNGVTEDGLMSSLLSAWDCQGGLAGQDDGTGKGKIAMLTTELMVIEAELIELITQMESGKILTAGDEIMAEMLVCEVQRISAEIRSVMSRARDRRGRNR